MIDTDKLERLKKTLEAADLYSEIAGMGRAFEVSFVLTAIEEIAGIPGMKLEIEKRENRFAVVARRANGDEFAGYAKKLPKAFVRALESIIEHELREMLESKAAKK